MIDSVFLQILVHLAIVLAHVLRIPAITASPILSRHIVARKGRRRSLERNIACAHDRLSEILEAVVDVPGHLDWVHHHRGGECEFLNIVGLEDSVQTM